MWLSRVLRDALEGRSEVDHTLLLTDSCVSFQIIFAGDPARIFHAIVTPQAALQKTLRDVLEEAVLPRLGADVHVALDKLRASIRVPVIILSNWADMKRTEEYLLPKASASHYEGLLSSVRGARSTAAKRQRSPTTDDRPTRPTTNLHSAAHHQAGSSPSGTGTAAKHLEFSAAAASPSLGPMGSPAQAAMVPTSTHLMPAPHYPTPVPASLPATELKVLNNWIQNRRLPKVHVAMSLLCQVCNLMPISPVIATCCGSTQCRACSNPTSALPPSAAAGSSKITCANCGEERFASEVLPPNQERAAAIERWMKDIAVLYREELAEMSRGILPLTLAAPHQQSVLEPPVAWGGPPGSRHVLYAPPPPPSSIRMQQGGTSMAGAPPPPPHPGLYPPSSSQTMPLSPHSPQGYQW